MLAQAAKKSGYQPLVIDMCGDYDLRVFAEAAQQITSLESAHLLPTINYFLERYPVTAVVYGTGFERSITSLRNMGVRLTLFGNPPEVFERTQDRPAFFALLNSLQITYPEVSFSLPNQSTSWLTKPYCGYGGIGIKRLQAGDRKNNSSLASVYWQRYQQGEPHSVLFLADGKRSRIIGFNRQWTVRLSEKDEFIFSGIINSTALSNDHKQQVSAWVAMLAQNLELRGLNSLDFIQNGLNCYALEINPRPPAGLQLYDADLFADHINACQGQLPDCDFIQEGYAAYQILYAQQTTLVSKVMDWPDGTQDIPYPNTLIGAGQPICSMIARGNEPDAVLKQLQIKQTYIINQLTTH